MNFIIAAPNSALALHKKKRHTMCEVPKTQLTAPALFLPEMFKNDRIIYPTILVLQEGDIKNFYLSAVVVDKPKIEQIEQKTRLQNNSIWSFERSLRITASKAHTLFIYKGKDWDLKLDGFLRPSHYRSVAMRYGINTEESALCCYSRTTKCAVCKVGLMINFDQPWLGCSPDGYNIDQQKLIEIKCPLNGKDMLLTDMLQTVKYIDQNYNLKKSHMYFSQMQVAMAVTNIQYCDFVLYSKYEDKCYIITISLDYEFFSMVLAKLRNIYFDRLLPKIFAKKAKKHTT